MKRALSIAASVLLFTGMSFAEKVTSIGTINNITIGSSFSLNLASWTQDGSATGQPQVGNARVNGNLEFTSMDMTTAGITANPAATGTADYEKTAHRANKYFNTVQFWIANNVYQTYKLDITASGNLFTAIAAPLAGQSVMHVTPITANYKITINGVEENKTTANPGFIVNKDQRVPVTTTATTLWNDTTTTIDGDDVFAAVFALDFMPVTIPSGTYTGSIQYDLISIL